MTGASIADLRRLVGVTPIDDTRSKGETTTIGPGATGLFGGQVIAQCLSAVERTVPAGAFPDSIHVNLLGRGEGGEPVELVVDEIRTGGALQQRRVRVTQNAALIAEATVVAALPVQGLEWQEQRGSRFAGPDRDRPSHFHAILGSGIIEVCRPEGTAEDASIHPLWVRAAVDVDDDPWLSAAACAYWSDFGMNGTTREKIAELSDGKIVSLSATHVLWLHRQVDAGRWHLFDAECRTISGNHGFAFATIHDDTGRHVGTVNQRVYVRAPLQ